MNLKINTLYFSATGTTEKIVNRIAQIIAKNFSEKTAVNTIDFTRPEARKKTFSFDKNDIVIFGIPVYAGRVPNVLLKFLNTISGNGAKAVAIVLYGNRNYDDALIEFKDILESDGFDVIAGGAFIGEHSFSVTLAAGRPDQQDMALAADFADKITNKIKTVRDGFDIIVRGNKPYRDYYRPKDPDGNPVSILKVTPKTNSNCTDCKLCCEICPMGSIDWDDVSNITGICIKCGACIKKCPVDAKYFDDEKYLRHKQELEDELTPIRREPEYFV
ncbi:EFR1 family ferrodoxin [uncultured Desulfobacter sp.]|uniref:EFR1 family ferrodoxin n=1 Tax=uncultured Desulfobacter sp. TaxID=240139 RepID=UPI002AAB09BA|nr:EFR1 family ferrodoxin [uncultured Desulfobacter sp.]